MLSSSSISHNKLVCVNILLIVSVEDRELQMFSNTKNIPWRKQASWEGLK